MADRHTPLVEQAALSDFITEGQLERHVRRMRRLYKHLRDVMLEALSRHFGSRAVVRGDAAGLHMTVRFTNGHDLRSRAAAAGVHISSSGIYYLNGARGVAATEYILRVRRRQRTGHSRIDPASGDARLNFGTPGFVWGS